MKKVFVWDLPVRLFHWILTGLIIVSFYTGVTGGFTTMDYHMWAGYGILALLLFRILWGFFGSHNARFGSFLVSPSKVIHYVRSFGHDPAPLVGHNPLGGLSIIAITLALLVQVGTGLFANDDILLEGPLAHLVSYDTSRWLTGIHKTNRYIVLGLIVIHILAVLYYQFGKKDNLIGPMITGWKTLDREVANERNNWMLAGILMVIAAGVVYGLVTWL